jgi:oligopeptidase B
LDASNPSGEFKVFLPRNPDHIYQIEDYKDKFYILTNWKALNFRLMESPLAASPMDEWKEIIPARPDVLLAGWKYSGITGIVGKNKSIHPNKDHRPVGKI